MSILFITIKGILHNIKTKSINFLYHNLKYKLVGNSINTNTKTLIYSRIDKSKRIDSNNIKNIEEAE
jgi:hypothetical protein